MQTANVMLALGGDDGNTVPKYEVTASEIAVLRLIHGESAVTDVAPCGEVRRSAREERSRLVVLYGHARPNDGDANAIDILFPGAAAPLFENIADLDLPEDFFKPSTRVTAPPAKKSRGKGRVRKNDDTGDADDGVEDIAPAGDDEALFD